MTVNRICHSGKLRARETAELLADGLGIDDLVQLEGMTPMDDVGAFVGRITDPDVMYVGHLPHLDRLASVLVAGGRPLRHPQGVYPRDAHDHQEGPADLRGRVRRGLVTLLMLGRLRALLGEAAPSVQHENADGNIGVVCVGQQLSYAHGKRPSVFRGGS